MASFVVRSCFKIALFAASLAAAAQLSAQVSGMPSMSMPMGGAGPLVSASGGVTFSPPVNSPVCCGHFAGHRFNVLRQGAFPQAFPLAPFGFWGYPFLLGQEPQVVILREQPQEPTPPPPPTHVVEPKIINVPASAEPEAKPVPKLPTVLVWRDGRQTQVRRYAITGSVLIDYTDPRRTRKIALDELDLDATMAINRQHGVAFRIPATANEIAVNF